MLFLYQAVKEILDAGRVGVPVFARCAIQIASDGKCAKNVVSGTLGMVCAWMEAVPLQVYAQNGGRSEQITVTVHYTGGQTAIVSVNTAFEVKNSIDLMLLGNKGALYHDTEVSAVSVEPPAEWLAVAVDESLRTGKPAFIEEVTDHE